ncbi:hypothetical protein [Thiocapsa sp.]|uniref:hypothetical protein n=1 Tax=Thiocapsa sp. TaxID=2024551 RepID=UPI0025DBFBAD|nr:hypothetical protein [Thiocapsa sp.]
MTKTAPVAVLVGCAALLPTTASSQTTGDVAAGQARQATVLETDSVESLQRQLAAQKAINAQLRARVQALEQELASGRQDDGPLILGLDASATKPPVEPDSATTAIEEALVGRGLVLLPTGTFRLTPRAALAHSGSGEEAFDSYALSLNLEAGLPWGMATSLQLPYIQRDYPAGRNDGIGDLSLSLSKRLNRETAILPSFVLRLDYRHDNGDDAFAAVPIGYGFQAVTATLSAVKRVEPLALYGNLSYSHAWPQTTTYPSEDAERTIEIEPADLYGIGLGVSLAATPDISLAAELAFDFQDGDRIAPTNGDAYRGTSTTIGYIDLGADFVLRKNLFLNLSAAAGVTDDANDFIFSIALPYRF